MATTQHRNGGGHSSRRSQQHGRSQRPSHLKRNSSYGLTRGAGKGSHTPKAEEEFDDDMMATTFLQYCTFCEKQIVVPAVSILYCSESCRKKDHNKTLAHASDDTNEVMAPLRSFSSTSLYDLPSRDIIPQRSPTALNRHRFSSYSGSSGHQSEEEQYSEDEVQHHHHRTSGYLPGSEAARYLRQFRHPDSIEQPNSRTPRPRYNRSSSSIAGLGLTTAAPSLSHSPTFTDAMSSLPYTPSTRPLPPRTNPFSSASYASRSIDLVNPYAHVHPTSTAPSSLANYTYGYKSQPGGQQGFAEGDLLYTKAAVCQSPVGGTSGSLKQLFRFSEMQAQPGMRADSRRGSEEQLGKW